jgi:hypothetical protein
VEKGTCSDGWGVKKNLLENESLDGWLRRSRCYEVGSEIYGGGLIGRWNWLGTESLDGGLSGRRHRKGFEGG